MPDSRIFHTEAYVHVQERVLEHLNSQTGLLSSATAGSTRAAGDAIQSVLADGFADLLGGLCSECTNDFARRAMQDIAFTDADGLYYCVDVKSHRADTTFSMPNLISVERLARFYEDDRNYFVVLMVEYGLVGNDIRVQKVHFVPIEFLSWSCLTIGALGWGQIQIANAQRIDVDETLGRRAWMLQLCDAVLAFYPREIEKIHGRIERFAQIRSYWEQKPADA